MKIEELNQIIDIFLLGLKPYNEEDSFSQPNFKIDNVKNKVAVKLKEYRNATKIQSRDVADIFIYIKEVLYNEGLEKLGDLKIWDIPF